MPEDRDNAQERSEQATPRRLQQAREKGQIARSRELNTTAVLVVSAGGLALLGPAMLRDLGTLMRQGFTRAVPPGTAGDLALLGYFEASAVDALLALAPFLLLVAVAALLAPMALGGWAFSPAALAFKWEKLDPIRGVQRLFSLKAGMELLKALAKFLLITGVTIVLLRLGRDASMALTAAPLALALRDAAVLVAWAFVALCASTIVIAAVDVPFQLWEHGRQLRMTRQEVKEDFKETEGKPELKQRIRTLQREVAQRRMMEAVPAADVVITNPGHYAVALRYSPGEMAAPRVVASGVDRVSQRIRERARQHGVPLIASPALARAIYHSTEIGQEIPAGLYLAVAAVLRYAYRLRGRPGYRNAPPPVEVPVPEELRHE